MTRSPTLVFAAVAAVLGAGQMAIAYETIIAHQYVPFTGLGDPAGLTSTPELVTGSVAHEPYFRGYVPYTGFGDPDGITSPGELFTGSIGSDADYVPYTGFGDPDGLTSPDYLFTGSIGGDADYVPYSGFGDPDGFTLSN